MGRPILVFVVAITLFITPAKAFADDVTFAIFLGAAKSFDSTVEMQFDNHPDQAFDAQWENYPMTGAPYYAWRLGWDRGDDAIELELIHHKIYLANEVDNIDEFEITHGYNLLTLNYTWKLDLVDLRFGGGIILAHPEIVAFGEPLEETHFMSMEFVYSGLTAQVAASKKFRLTDYLSGIAEVKLTASNGEVPLEEASVTVPIVAIHFLVGIDFNYSLD
jgi:hypothetical protein